MNNPHKRGCTCNSCLIKQTKLRASGRWYLRRQFEQLDRDTDLMLWGDATIESNWPIRRSPDL